MTTSQTGLHDRPVQRIALQPSVSATFRTLLIAALLSLGLAALNSAVGSAYGDRPALTGLSPTSGPVDGGTAVTITGTAFNEATAVNFGSTPATSFTVHSATSITAISPQEVPGTVHVTVTTPGGTSRLPHSHFKFTPTITALSANTGYTTGGATVTVTGTGFAPGTATVFEFGAKAASSVKCTSSTECTVVAPTHKYEYVNVTATVNKATSPVTFADHFRYIFAEPHVYITGVVHGERVRLPAGTQIEMREVIAGASDCFAYIFATIAVNGEPTDQIRAESVAEYASCDPREWSGVLPSRFTLNLNYSGTATIDGPIEESTEYGCVYDADKMSGSFGEGGAHVEETLPLVGNPAQERLESELEEVLGEIKSLEETAERTIQQEEELAELRERKLVLEHELAAAERACAETQRVSLSVEGEQLGFETLP